MNDYWDNQQNAAQEECAVCAILSWHGEKYANRLPYHLQEDDFTSAECRNIFRAVHDLVNSGRPSDMFSVYDEIESHYPEGTDSEAIPEKLIIFLRVDESRMGYSARTVRMAAIQRRLWEDAYPDEESRLAAQQELADMEDGIMAIRQQILAEAEQRRLQLELLERQENWKQLALTCKPKNHPLLPILKKMVQSSLDGTHSGCFWSYAEVRSLCKQELGFDPVRSSRELLTILPDSFRKYLAENENIYLQLRQRSCNTRGLRITPLYRKRTQKELLYAAEFVPQQLPPPM